MEKVPSFSENVPGHENFDMEDAANCPFLKSKKKSDQDSEAAKQNTGGGGCPVMQMDETKKNPKLEPFPHMFEVPYSSPMDFMFNRQSLFGDRANNPNLRETFDKYPIYLKETLFLDDKSINELRGVEIAQRFMAVEEIKEKGNESYHAQDFDEAYKMYLSSYSLLKWLTWDDAEGHEAKSTKESDTQENEIQETKDQANDQILDMDVTKMNTLNFIEKLEEVKSTGDLSKEELRQYAEVNIFNSLKAKNKSNLSYGARKMLAQFDDSNVSIGIDDVVIDTTDVDFKNSILFGVLMNIACVFLAQAQFSAARAA